MDSSCLIKSFCLGILFSCSEPFEDNRHDLTHFRIAAANVINGIGDAVIWSGEGRFHQTSPTLDWFIEDEHVGAGYEAVLPESEHYTLKVTNAEGTVLNALVVSGERQTDFSLQLSLVQFQDYNLEYRKDQPSTSFVDHVPDGQHLRISSTANNGKMRWMSAQGVGSFLELSQTEIESFDDWIRSR